MRAPGGPPGAPVPDASVSTGATGAGYAATYGQDLPLFRKLMMPLSARGPGAAGPLPKAQSTLLKIRVSTAATTATTTAITPQTTPPRAHGRLPSTEKRPGPVNARAAAAVA